MKSKFIIQGADLELVPLSEDCLSHTLAWRNRPGIRRWFKSKDELSFEQHKNWFLNYLDKEDDFTFLVKNKGSDEYFGQVAIYRVDHINGFAEIGRFISAPGHEGRGHIRKACIYLIEFAFAVMGLNRIMLEVFCENERAISIYQSLGFRELGNNKKLKTMILCKGELSALIAV